MEVKNIKGLTVLAVIAALIFCLLPLHKLAPADPVIHTYSAKPAEASTYCTESYAPEVDNPLDPYEVELIGRTIWGEAEGVEDKAEQAAVAWCVLNRVDASGKTIEEIVTAPYQFYGFRKFGEVPEEFLQLAEDVLLRWRIEKRGGEDVGRVLPEDYLFFIGDGEHNYFSKEWQATDYWDWSLKSPY